MSDSEERERPRVYVCLDAFFDEDPAIVAAGPWAAVAFQALIRASKRTGQRGHLRAAQMSGRFLAHLTMFDRPEAWECCIDTNGGANVPNAAVAFGGGVRALVAEGVLTPCDGTLGCPPGCHYLRSWTVWQRDPKTGPERTAKWRAKKHVTRGDEAPSPAVTERHGASNVTAGDAAVTPCDAGDADGDLDVEVDVEREDQTPLSPPARRGGGDAPSSPSSPATTAQKAYRRKRDHLVRAWRSATEDEVRAVNGVIACWQEVMRSDGGGSVECRVAILDRLRDPVQPATTDRLKLAVRGCARTPHNMGQNERGTLYNTLDLICRSGANVDRFAAAANGASGARTGSTEGRPCAYAPCGKPLGTAHIDGCHPPCYQKRLDEPMPPRPTESERAHG